MVRAEYKRLKDTPYTLALTSNAKYLPPFDPYYLSSAKAHRDKAFLNRVKLGNSEQDTNMFETHNLRNYTNYCPNCSSEGMY